ncbi:MAG: hypothetical protein HY921_12700 [Elusimicrobia bacterium]|nr:hypothetical protein [Elusimicrobiota bacterium]
MKSRNVGLLLAELFLLVSPCWALDKPIWEQQLQAVSEDIPKFSPQKPKTLVSCYLKNDWTTTGFFFKLHESQDKRLSAFLWQTGCFGSGPSILDGSEAIIEHGRDYFLIRSKTERAEFMLQVSFAETAVPRAHADFLDKSYSHIGTVRLLKYKLSDDESFEDHDAPKGSKFYCAVHPELIPQQVK